MFRSVNNLGPGCPALRTAFLRSGTLRPPSTPQPPARTPAPIPLDEHLAVGNTQEEAARVLLPTDLAFAAQNQAIRLSRELARSLLAAMPTKASPQDVAAAVRVMQAISAYQQRPITNVTINILA